MGIPLLERIENATLGREAISAAAREELRLLYVGFTRARDMLVLATRNGQPSAWLDLLDAPWLRPLEGPTPRCMDCSGRHKSRTAPGQLNRLHRREAGGCNQSSLVSCPGKLQRRSYRH